MRGGLSLADGLGRRLVPFGARGMPWDRLLNVGFVDGERLSEPEAVTRRCEEIGMRDLELGLPGDPSSALICCKGTETAMLGSQGAARG